MTNEIENFRQHIIDLGGPNKASEEYKKYTHLTVREDISANTLSHIMTRAKRVPADLVGIASHLSTRPKTDFRPDVFYEVCE